VILKAALFTFLVLISGYGWSQTFPAKGQYPSTSFPICGYDTIRQLPVPLGFTTTIPVPGCGGYPDTNPYYYSFTCYISGTLGFIITPNLPGDDYDWMLFDFTGINPSLVFTDSTLNITGNRSGVPGPTGAKNGGVTSAECSTSAAEGISPFTSMPFLIKGHQYLLLVSHTAPSQSGYTLVFTGGTAVLNDPALPKFLSVVVSCDRKLLTVGLTKFVQCKSLAADGSDFFIQSYTGSIVEAVGLNCSPQFDYDYMQLFLSDPLPAGNYSLVMKNGTDGNTLLDDCSLQAQVGENINFSVSVVQPALDSLTPPACTTGILHLVFSTPIECSSIAADGSDFRISGSTVVGIAKATGNCSGDTTSHIDIILDSPIVSDGNYQISLVTGSDGNTLTNECGVSALPGASLPFSVKGAVSATFDYSIDYGCKYDTINLSYLPENGVNQWLWTVDTVTTSELLNPSIVETVFGVKNVQHIVSNGICSDTVSKSVDLGNILKAAFKFPGEVCPKDVVAFSNTSIGNIVSYYWDFGDGTNSSQQNPPDHLFPDTWAGKTYNVSLTVQGNTGCMDTLSGQITKLQSCSVAVPNAFTPNGDGKNDYLYPLNAFTVSNLEFQVFNRYGQLVFETRDWTKKWDGTINGQPQETGTYVWILQYTDGSGKKISSRGSTVLIR
jgi:gliding motility-associated-like protein